MPETNTNSNLLAGNNIATTKSNSADATKSSSALVSSASAVKSSASSNVSSVSSASQNSSSNSNADTKKSDVPQAPATQEWKGNATDQTHQRTLNITETDGTKITLVMHFTSVYDAENIIGSINVQYTDESGNTYTRNTLGDYHRALMGIFGVAIVNGVAAGKPDFDFFEKHEFRTYTYAMDEADSFLGNLAQAFKA